VFIDLFAWDFDCTAPVGAGIARPRGVDQNFQQIPGEFVTPYVFARHILNIFACLAAGEQCSPLRVRRTFVTE